MSALAAPAGELDPDDQVLDTVMVYLKALPGEWSMGRLFAVYLRDPKQGSTRKTAHRTSVQKFLSGTDTVYNAYSTVHLMLKHPSAVPENTHDEYDQNYSLKQDPRRLRHFSPAITSYFAQDVLSALRGELSELFKDPNLRARVSQVQKKSAPSSTNEPGLTFYSDDEADLEETAEPTVVVRTEPGVQPTSAQKKTRGLSKDKLVDRSTLRDFTMEGLAKKYKRAAPLLWGLLFGVANPTARTDHKHRPPWIVVTSVLSQLVFCANSYVNKFQFIMSAYMFGTKAHHSMWRVGSRLAQNLSFTSLRNGLAVISGSNISWIQSTTESGSIDWAGILDNMQFYAIRRDIRIGVTNAMENGTGAYLLRMVDLEDGALDLLPILVNILQGKRRAATLEALLDDIDWEKADLLVTLHILRILVNHVDCLRKRYLDDVDKLFAEKARILQIDPNRKSEIHPLGSNGANEVTHKGMRAALSDFVFTQMGIKVPVAEAGSSESSPTATTPPSAPFPPSSSSATASVSTGPVPPSDHPGRVRRKGFPWSGDGKSYDGIVRVKRLLHAEKDDDISNLAFILPELEHWHEEWTYNRALVHGHWGEGFETEDSSTLGFAASRINSPKPADFSKSLFDSNDYIIRVATQAHALQMWEEHLVNETGPRRESSTLEQHFEQLVKADKFPPLTQLFADADLLRRRYATKDAFMRAVTGKYPSSTPLVKPPPGNTIWQREPANPSANPTPAPAPFPESRPYSDDVDGPMPEDAEADVSSGSMPQPAASAVQTEGPKKKETRAEQTKRREAMLDDLISAELGPRPFTGDWQLANGIMLLIEGLLYEEYRTSIACGDVGRMFNTEKQITIRFASGSNPHYLGYGLEMWCSHKYDYPAKTSRGLLLNSLVNLHGQPKRFIPKDLHLEHLNKWMEEMGQHKNQDFDSVWMRQVLAPNSHDLTQLIDRMEAEMELSPRSKKHSEPDWSNEIRDLRNRLREDQIYRLHPGRDRGFHAKDTFEAGCTALGQGGKLAAFIESSTEAIDAMTAKLDLPTSSNDPDWLHVPVRYGAEGEVIVDNHVVDVS